MDIKFIDSSVEKFIYSLEKSTIAKVLRTIDFLEKFGSKLSMPYAKKITSRIFELRIRGAEEVRLLYTFHRFSVIILHGFKKKSQRISHKEIEIAFQKLKRLDKI